jgi:tetratricopeptide (TPR) repeat protein
MDEKEKSKYLGDVEYFSAKLEADPSSVLFVPLARAYIKLERYSDAVNVLTTGIDSSEDVFAAKTMLARAYVGMGKIDDAKAILTEVQVLDKKNYLASKLMGDILRSEDQIKKALVSYRNAFMVAPEDMELKNIIEELMAASGIAAHELEDDFDLMDADDEMLEQLGSELAEEVRTEVGEKDLGQTAATDDEVSRTIDDIIGAQREAEDDEDMSLENFQQDASDLFSDELEEELMASLDDEIIPTPLSADEHPGGAVMLDDEVMKQMQEDEDSPPDEDAVRALAAELGADLGLDMGDAPEMPQDELDSAIDDVFEKQEGEMPDFFADVMQEEEQTAVSEDDLLAELREAEGVSPEAEDIESMLQMVEAEKEAVSEEPTFEEPEPEPESGVDAEEPDILAEIMQGASVYEEMPADVIEDFADEPADEITDEVIDEPVDEDLEEPIEEPIEEIEDETSEHIFEASLEELMEKGPQETEKHSDELPEGIREQVNRLENLLEIIKNNAQR